MRSTLRLAAGTALGATCLALGAPAWAQSGPFVVTSQSRDATAAHDIVAFSGNGDHNDQDIQNRQVNTDPGPWILTLIDGPATVVSSDALATATAGGSITTTSLVDAAMLRFEGHATATASGSATAPGTFSAGGDGLASYRAAFTLAEETVVDLRGSGEGLAGATFFGVSLRRGDAAVFSSGPGSETGSIAFHRILTLAPGEYELSGALQAGADASSAGLSEARAEALGSFVLAPVPEPAAWGLMLGGLALLVGAVRRCRRA